MYVRFARNFVFMPVFFLLISVLTVIFVLMLSALCIAVLLRQCFCVRAPMPLRMSVLIMSVVLVLSIACSMCNFPLLHTLFCFLQYPDPAIAHRVQYGWQVQFNSHCCWDCHWLGEGGEGMILEEKEGVRTESMSVQ